jgi:PDDEXK-like uncharacterized protein DUF3799
MNPLMKQAIAPFAPPTSRHLTSTVKLGVFRGEPEEQYHSAAGYVSSSPLPELDKSPAHFLEKWNNGVEATPAMDRGTFIHKILLEQDIAKYVARPVKDDGSLVRSNSKEYAAFLEANVGKKPIDAKIFEGAFDVLNSACQNSKYVAAFNECEAEVSFYAIDELTGLSMKARVDQCPKWLIKAIETGDFSEFQSRKDSEGLYLSDVKSTADIFRFNDQIFKSFYHVRLVHYTEVVKAVAKQIGGFDIGDIDDLRFMAIESKRPFATRNFKLKPADVADARIKWRQWMNTIAACKADNEFPSLSDGWIAAEKPRFLEDTEEVSFNGGFE